MSYVLEKSITYIKRKARTIASIRALNNGNFFAKKISCVSRLHQRYVAARNEKQHSRIGFFVLFYFLQLQILS